MKPAVFFLMFLMSLSTVFYAQESAPFEFKDEKAIIIDNNVLEMLMDKYWEVYKQYTLIDTESDEYTQSALSFVLNKDNSFTASKGTIGVWEVQKNKLLHLSVKSDHFADQEKLIGGSYSIYNITNNHLVIVKNLTSDLKAKIIFYCKLSEKKENLARPVAVRTSLTKEELEAKWAAQEEKLAQMDDEKLELEIRLEFFIRNLETPDNIEELTRDELIELYKKIIRGQYKN